MKKTLSLLFLLFSLCSVAQDLESLKLRAYKTFNATSKLDFNTVLDLTYPKLFTIAPRDMMLTVLEQTFNGNADVKIKMITVNPDFNFGPIKKIENQLFCVIKHNNEMEMIFTAKIEDPNVYIEILKNSMKTDAITFDKEKNSFYIKIISTMIAVSDETTKNEWTFLNDDKSGKIFEMLFNEKIKTELGL